MRTQKQIKAGQNFWDRANNNTMQNKTEHKHRYFLKQDSFSKKQYHRECECGKKAKCTKYKINL